MGSRPDGLQYARKRVYVFPARYSLGGSVILETRLITSRPDSTISLYLFIFFSLNLYAHKQGKYAQGPNTWTLSWRLIRACELEFLIVICF